MATSVDPVVVGEPVKASDFNTAATAIDELNQIAVVSQGKNVLGGSFETDNIATGEPDSWTMTDVSGGSHALETTIVDDGAQSLKMTATGAGGFVTAQSDDFIQITGGIDTVFVAGSVRQDVAAVIEGDVLFYNAAQSLIATVPFMEMTALSAVDTWYPIRGHADAPSTARYFKIILTGGDGAAASNIYWDGMATDNTPFDWVFDESIIFSGQFVNTTQTAQIGDDSLDANNAVGYPKWARARRINFGDRTHDSTFLGWDGSGFTSDVVMGDYSGPVSITEYVAAEIPLDPTGQLQSTFDNVAGTTGSVQIQQIAFR